jgi:hypothetical protein
MKIYHYHPETGVLLGEGMADESPLEPGVWLIPAYATALKPPESPLGWQVINTNGRWELQLIPKPPEPPEPPAPEPPPVLTTEQKLEAAGLTVAELRELFGLPEPELS